MDRMDHRDSKPLQSGETPGHPAIFIDIEGHEKIMSQFSEASRPAKKKRTYRKNQPLFTLIGKMKLWPSRKGILHGIRSMEIIGNSSVISTHCGKTFTVRNSRNSRAGRWLRNKIYVVPCKVCAVPDWKLEKYQRTSFQKKSGAVLDRDNAK